MQLTKHLPQFILLVLALSITALISRVIPEKQFAPYTLELDSVWQKNTADQEYVVDINKDSVPEFFTHHNINQTGHSIEYRKKNHLHTIHIFYKDDFFISKFLYFHDVIQDGKKEIIFITAIDKIAWLNIFTFNDVLGQYKQERKIEIGPVRYYNNKPDAINYFIFAHQSEIYFDLTPGYSVSNRHIYKFDCTNNSLTLNDKNSFVIKKAGLINQNGENYLLAREMLATGNTMTRFDYESMEKSTDKDTIEMFKTYKPLKHLVYDYGDFSSYILLFNSKLKFAFDPIEFVGWTNYTKSEFLTINNIPHIAALTNTDIGNIKNKLITICDFKGKIVKQMPLPHDYTDIYTGNGNIVFKDKKNLFVYSNTLEMVKTVPNITVSAGFFDINGDKESEFIAFRNNEMLVFSPDFDLNARFDIGQEFIPYPEENSISLLQAGSRKSFTYNTNQFYYLFSYNQNSVAIFKYPFYILVFLLLTGLLSLILKLNTKRLEKEKQRLEEIVSERTIELQSKNQKLAEQKEEIQSQAEEITQQYQQLEKLDQLKETLTHTLVHDLKNPLSQILTKSPDKQIKHIAAKMLGLVSNMLDVEKHEHTTISLVKQSIKLDSLINEVIEGQEISLQEKNIAVTLISENPGVVADPALLSRVIENLLSNAIRHTPLNASITISATTKHHGRVQVAIANPGSHIAPELLQTIFDKYVQGSNSASSSGYRTTGLGLTFCRMVVEAHGHTITAANTPEGVEFYFTLDGDSSGQETQQTLTTSQNQLLSDSDRQLLQPWLSQLQPLEAYMGSAV